MVPASVPSISYTAPTTWETVSKLQHGCCACIVYPLIVALGQQYTIALIKTIYLFYPFHLSKLDWAIAINIIPRRRTMYWLLKICWKHVSLDMRCIMSLCYMWNLWWEFVTCGSHVTLVTHECECVTCGTPSWVFPREIPWKSHEEQAWTLWNWNILLMTKIWIMILCEDLLPKMEFRVQFLYIEIWTCIKFKNLIL